ncbi:laminin EGF-like protein, partial [Ostertagia ostertagi]
MDPRRDQLTMERLFNLGTFFAETPAECMRQFGMESLSPISEDDRVVCRSDLAGIHPLENAEMVIKILEHRPSRFKFSSSEALQNFTRATNVRIRLLGTRTLQGHLMHLNDRTDPTVTRRYFYSIKRILMGGRCVCNGHAGTCDILDPRRPAHSTSQTCNCFGRSDECVYDEDVFVNSLSLDIHGNYEGGGRCLNCRVSFLAFYCSNETSRKVSTATSACSVTIDRMAFSGTTQCRANRADATQANTQVTVKKGTGKCYCQPRFQGDNCDQCAPGYYDPPECKKCECAVDGTMDGTCL